MIDRVYLTGKNIDKASSSTQLGVPLMEETPVQIRALADSRPPGRLFIADLRQSHALNKAPLDIELDAFESTK